MIGNALNLSYKRPVPGMNNILSPSQGTSGIRLIIKPHGASATHPYTEGIDIPCGISASIGITAQRVLHLPYPYTNCSAKHQETHLLLAEMRKKLPSLPAEIDTGTYTQFHCRYDLCLIFYEMKTIPAWE